ncbi:MAG: TraR/DksA family transcriptional regulator [Myxococcota bacterium]
MVDEAELTDAQLEDLRVLLTEKRDAIRATLTASEDDARPVGLDLSIGRLTRVDALQQQHMATARRERLETQLSQIQQALGRLDSGAYGDCLRCDEPIAFARLKVRPEAPFCVRCQGGRGEG